MQDHGLRFQIHLEQTRASPQVHPGCPAAGRVGQNDTTCCVFANELQPIIFIGRPGKLGQKFSGTHGNIQDTTDECEGHVNYVWASLPEHASSETMSPVL